ncbi:MAG: response regulator transcription factor [Planctomycetaceae bacterium]|nr:response regulator transcription factor [Planctomycetaceae bacterium]
MIQNAATVGNVYIVEDDADLRRSLDTTLRSMGYAVESFGGADEFLQQTADAPGCLLVDLLLPGITGLKLCREVVRKRLPCSFVLMSGHGDVPSAVEAMRLGAIDFLEKPFSYQQLLTVVDQACRSAQAMCEQCLADAVAAKRLATLTPRERQVFDAIADGLVTKEIAKRFNISSRTIDVHRSRIMEKLGITSHNQLAHLIAAVSRMQSGAPCGEAG